MAVGKVKWFNNAKGYGFILPEEGGEDLFAHYSSIQMDGYKTLKAGQDVEYERLEGPKGFHAVNIRAVGATAADYSPEDAPAQADGAAGTGEAGMGESDAAKGAEDSVMDEASMEHTST